MKFLIILSLILVSINVTHPYPYTHLKRGDITAASTIKTMGLVNMNNTIGFIPDYCVAGPEPMSISDQFASVVGSYPVWAAMNGLRASIVFLGDDPATEFGWQQKFLWIMRNSYTGTVTISGKNIETDQPVFFQLNSQEEPSDKLVLQIGDNSAFTFADFPGTIFIPSAGCYLLEVQWEGGYWGINFSAGRITQTALQSTVNHQNKPGASDQKIRRFSITDSVAA